MAFRHVANRFGWESLYLLSSRWPLALLVGSLVLFGGAIASRLVVPLYEAEARIALGPSSLPDGLPFDHQSRERSRSDDLFGAAEELRSPALLLEVAGSLALASRWNVKGADELTTQLRSRLDVEILPETRCLIVRISDDSPSNASSMANALADRFVLKKDAGAKAEARARVAGFEQEIERRHQEIDAVKVELVSIADKPGAGSQSIQEKRRRLVTLENLIRSLRAKLQLAHVETEEVSGDARVIGPALPDRAKTVVPFWRSGPGLVSIGLCAGVATILLMALCSPRSRWRVIADLMERFQLHFAGFAPLGSSAGGAGRGGSASILEPYRELRNRLLRLPAGDHVWMTMMPLRRSETGQEATARLAAVLADSGHTVLVIDADFRAPSLHSFFDAAHHPGLLDYLSGEMRLEETVIRTRRMNLWFMPAGPLHGDSGGLLNGKRMDDLVRELRSRFEFILVASPSIHEDSDAVVLASLSEFNVLVTPYHGLSLRRLRETQIALETVNAPLSGILLTTRINPPLGASVATSGSAASRVAATGPALPVQRLAEPGDDLAPSSTKGTK
jgi:hypothetical protein